MSHHSARGPRGLGSLVLCSLTVSSLLLGGLLQPAPAWAAQEEPEAAGPAATLTGLAVEEGTLVARILWSKSPEGLPEHVKVTSHDGKGEVNDSVGVIPKPGEVTEVKLAGALKEPWTTGWAQKLVLEDPSKAEVLLTQPYDINLSCDTATQCRLVVAPGVASNPDVIHVSEELEEALAEIEARYGDTEFDLMEVMGKQYPSLTGETLVYAQQLSQWMTLSGPCTCTWKTSMTRTPGGLASQITSPSTGNGWVWGWEGPGATHFMSALGLTPTGVGRSATGKSSVKVGLTCTQWTQSWINYVGVVMATAVVFVPIPYPVEKYCTSGCQAQFDHQGRISGTTSVGSTPFVSTAAASLLSYYRVDGVMEASGYGTQGSSFDNSTTATRYSNTASTGTVDASSYVSATSNNASLPGTAFVSNGHALSIYGSIRCQYAPRGPAAVWDYGTFQGPAQTQSLRSSIQGFFLQRGYYVNP